MIAAIRREWRGQATTTAVCLFLIGLLELRLPYYFLQDDGLEYFLPSYVHNWRSLLSGNFPLYNFHTFGGVPHFSMGQPATLYVPQYGALLASRMLFGHFFAAIDILAIFHLLVAALGTYLLLRHWKLGQPAAAFGGITALSGFCLLVGRMWPPAVMLCAWFPCMLLAAERFRDRPSAGRASMLVAARLALFYGGYPQFFVLAILFEHLFVLLRGAMRREMDGKRLLSYFATAIPTLLLACPLLLPMMVEVKRSAMRAQPLPYEHFASLSVAPLQWVYGQFFAGVPLPGSTGGWLGTLLYISHIGYVPAAFSLCALILLRKDARTRALLIPCLVCCLLALLWAWNAIGPWIYHVPIFNRFRWPFKLVFFSGLFQCVMAAVFLDRCRRGTQYAAIAAFSAGWLWVYLLLPNHAWRIHEHTLPLSSAWRSELSAGRYVVIDPHPIDSGGEDLLEFNYAELWGLENLLGYEPLIDAASTTARFGAAADEHMGAYFGVPDAQAIEKFHQWSVRFVVVSPGSQQASDLLQQAGWSNVAARNGWRLWEDPRALPRVRFDGKPLRAGPGLTWKEGVNSLGVSLRGAEGGRLTFAYSFRPGLESCIDGRCSAVSRSAGDLIQVDVPPGASHVELVYRNALFVAGSRIAATTVALLSLAGFVALRRRLPARRARTPESRPSSVVATEA
jgi:hypothetical protein